LVAGTEGGEVLCLQIASANSRASDAGIAAATNLPLVTPVRLYLFGDDGAAGRWSDRVTTLCPHCAQRFELQETVFGAIGGITRNARLSPEQSPCIDLPKEAWDEPTLLSACRLCGKPLRFNPFVVDNRGQD
jgi:hypothetical protein